MEVQCIFRPINFAFSKDRQKNQAGYCCRVEKILKLDYSYVANVEGEHQELKTNLDVVGVSFDKKRELERFPRGFGKIFPNLRYMQVNRCSLNVLEKDDFLDLKHLHGLWLTDNSIVELKDDLFTNVQGLKYLCFEKNKLKYIDVNILEPLKNLKRANFRDNTCIDANFDEDRAQLILLKHEIVKKCQPPQTFSIQNGNNSDNYNNHELKNQVAILEAKNNRLEAEIRSYQFVTSSLQATVANLSTRLSTLEEKFRNVFEL